jgi:hypothetical protein
VKKSSLKNKDVLKKITMNFAEFLCTTLRPEKTLTEDFNDPTTYPYSKYDLIFLGSSNRSRPIDEDVLLRYLDLLVYDGFLTIPLSLSIMHKTFKDYEHITFPEFGVKVYKRNDGRLRFLIPPNEVSRELVNPIYTRYTAERHFDRTWCINYLAQSLKVGKYLELGICQAETLRNMSTIVPECHGVDVTPPNDVLPQSIKFYHMTTDDFFVKTKYYGYFDMIYIDANHNIEYVKRDLINALKCLQPNGLILLDDTYPPNSTYFNPRFCEDAYLISKFCRETMCDKVEMLTLPFAPGLTMVRKLY